MRNYLLLSVILILFVLETGCEKESNHTAPDTNIDTIYHPFVDTNKIWSTGALSFSAFSFGLPFYPDYSFYNKIGSDTTINDQMWYKVVESRDEAHENWIFRYCYILESDKKVFLKWIYGGNEILMYDFSKKAGDTVKIKSIFSLNGSEDNFIVDSVKFLPVLNSVKRRHFFLHSQKNLRWNFTWIEGFGSINGFFENRGMYGQYGGLYRLICIEENDLVIYKDSVKYGFNKCFFPNAGK